MSQPRYLAQGDHSICASRISPHAASVLRRLDRGGYKAFVVGGAVRDLLLDREPKDFDIATDARPQQIRRLFRNSRIIGRRFRIVHIIFAHEIVEVTTFRGAPDPEFQKGGPEDLLVTNDNTYGSPEEDAERRDFSINGLFYDFHDETVIDYVEGIYDLEDRLVRVIGDPDLRFQEDPVRMLRACEMAGRLDFDIEEETEHGIRSNREHLERASTARLTEELLQILRSGSARTTFEWVLELDLLDAMLPELEDLFDSESPFGELLEELDERSENGEVLPDAVLIGSLIAPALVRARGALETGAGSALDRGTLERLVERAVEGFAERFSLAHISQVKISQMLSLFQRLCEPVPHPRKVRDLARRAAFKQAVELFGLLCAASGAGSEPLEPWRDAIRASESLAPRRRRRRRRKR